MKKAFFTSCFLFGLISFSIGQTKQKKHVATTSSMQHDNEIIALKKQEIQRESELTSSSVIVPLTPELQVKSKVAPTKKLKSIKK